MLRLERQERIARLVEEQGILDVPTLCQALEVSEATIRRDLAALEAQGMLQRTRGGAAPLRREGTAAEIARTAVPYLAEKVCFGRKAAEMIGDGETVFLGVGTTTYQLAQHLPPRPGLTVITNALNIATLLGGNPALTLIVTGGVMRPSDLSLIGHLTEEALQDLRADKLFLSLTALSPKVGLTDHHLPQVLTYRAIMSVASEVILVMDHSKLGKVAPAFVAPLTAAHKIITDDAAPPAMVAEIRAMGIEVILA